MSVVMTDDDRIEITPEYEQGREAYRQGRDYWSAADGIADFYRRLDAFIGYHDEQDGVTVEQRRAAERNGLNV